MITSPADTLVCDTTQLPCGNLIRRMTMAVS